MALSDPLYLLFLAIVVTGIRWIPEGAARLLTLAFVSLCFYMAFALWYGLILVAVIVIAYSFGLILRRLELGAARSIIFFAALALTFAPLFAFKYLGVLSGLFGPDALFAQIILPIGISFYTFQAAGYLIDVHLENVPAERSFIQFASFICFFPVIAAGPIERASHLLPQLSRIGSFDYALAVAGLRAILTGLFLKIVVADSLAPLVDRVYSAPSSFGSLDLCLATIYFSFQVYTDFAGYTLIAIGSARLLGVELLPNFAQPFLSQSLPEFWRSWHMTMSSWFRDYVFTPLQFQMRRRGNLGLSVALIITFVLVGLWHGAGWKFAVFGMLHGVLLSASMLTLKARNRFWKRIGIPDAGLFVWRAVATFGVATATFVLFRAGSLQDAWGIYKGIAFGGSPKVTLPVAWPAALIAMALFYDLAVRFKLAVAFDRSVSLRWTAYYIASLTILAVMGFRLLNGSQDGQQFIYFKF